MGDSAFLPLEEVPTFAATNVKSYAFRWTLPQVGSDQNALHPVVEVAHQLDGTLKGGEGGKKEEEGKQNKNKAYQNKNSPLEASCIEVCNLLSEYSLVL